MHRFVHERQIRYDELLMASKLHSKRNGLKEPKVESQISPERLPPNPDGDLLKSPDLYINRELSLLEFQCRVLEEAADAGNPLLERLKFLAILGSNLDEFFMVRVAGLMKQVASGMSEVGRDGRPAAVAASADSREGSPDWRRKPMTLGAGSPAGARSAGNQGR